MSCEKANILECCLFFTANSLARTITRMGEEEFAKTGLAPSSAFLLTLAMEQPGISQKELAASLHLAPSTVSRLVDSLRQRGLVNKEGQGRNSFIRATPQGFELAPRIAEAWKALHERYSRILGREHGEELTRLTREAFLRLETEG